MTTATLSRFAFYVPRKMGALMSWMTTFILLLSPQWGLAQDLGVRNPLLQVENPWPELVRGSNGLVPRVPPPKPARIVIDNPRMTVSGVFALKFVEGSHIRLVSKALRFDPSKLALADEGLRLSRTGLKIEQVAEQLNAVRTLLDYFAIKYGFKVTYMFRAPTVPEDSDEQFNQKASLEQRGAEELADLDLYYVVHGPSGTDMALEQELMNQLNRYQIVETVYPVMIASPAQALPTPDVSWQQGYLGPAPIGLDGLYSHSRRGGRGEGVRLIDVEYDWVKNHEDFPPDSHRFWGDRPACPYVASGSEHGTAVMGIIAAPENGFGVTGFAPNVSYGLSSVCRPFDYLWASAVASFSGENWAGRAHNVVVANAINDAAQQLRAGDVLLVEQHVPGPFTGAVCSDSDCDQWEYVPMEFYQESFDVIQRATAAGIVVVEAAGNGGQNLDSAVYSSRFDFTRRNSRALLIGASGAGDLSPAAFSNRGRRVDLFAWGDGVVTLGYGIGPTPPFTFTDIPRHYRNNFGGTSSASAIIAGAIASYQGTRLASGLLPYSAIDMRNVLFTTGLPRDRSLPIGRQPDLRQAISSVFPGGFTGPGTYTIVSKSSGKVLDINIDWFQGQDDLRPCVQFPSHGGANQQFRILPSGDGSSFLIEAVHSGKLLDVRDESVSNGAEIVQFHFDGSTSQRFRIEPVGEFARIVNVHSGKVLDIPGSSTADQTHVQQFQSTDGDNQQFRFVRLTR